MKQGLAHFFRHHWDALLASLAAGLFIFLFTRHSGIGISPDSVAYQTTAENIRTHFSFHDFNNLPLVDFPLGYPSFLALMAGITGNTVLAVAPLLNACLLSAVIIITSYLISGFRNSDPWYKLVFLSLLACSPALLEVYDMLWSETLFIFWVMLFLLVTRTYLLGCQMRTVWAMGAIAAIAMVTRYAGITLVATGSFILLFNGSTNTRTKIKSLAVFVPLSLSLFVLNLVRNHLVAGSFTGVRQQALRSLGNNFRGMAAAIGEWFPFIHEHLPASIILLSVVLVLALAAVIYRLLQQQFYHEGEMPVAVFLLIYLSFMLVVSSVSRFEELSSRLLSPAYIPFLLFSTKWLLPLVRKQVMPWRLLPGVLAFGIAASFHAYHYRLNAEAWEGIKDAGMPGYAEDSWTQSPTISYVRSVRDSLTGPVYANANDAVYYLTGIHPLPLPHKDIVNELNALNGLQQFYLIWLVDGANADLVSLHYLQEHMTVTAVREFEDGALYRCERK